MLYMDRVVEEFSTRVEIVLPAPSNISNRFQ